MIREEKLYDPVRNKLQEIFSQFGMCQLEITSRKISNRMKATLDTFALYFLRVEKFYPDILGQLILEIPAPKHPTVNYMAFQSIVVEVKTRPIKLKDIYQTKTYAEIFNATHAFFIYSGDRPVEISRFLDEKPNILSYLDYNLEMQRIIPMQFNLDEDHFIPSDGQVAAEIIDGVEKEKERILKARRIA